MTDFENVASPKVIVIEKILAMRLSGKGKKPGMKVLNEKIER